MTLAPAPERQGARFSRSVLVLVAGVVALVGIGWITARLAHALAPGWALTNVDANVTGYFAARRQGWLTTVNHVVTWLGSLPFVALVVAVSGLTARLQSGRWEVLWLPSLAGGGAFVISAAVKLLSARDRPSLDVAVVGAYGPAFPSGHTLRAVAVFGAFAYLAAVASRSRQFQILVWSCAAVAAGAVGVSRVYLGVHWLTDVIAGAVLGAAWLALVVVTVGRLLPRPAVGAP